MSRIFLLSIFLLIILNYTSSQGVVIGKGGEIQNVIVTHSDNTSSGDNTLTSQGFLPNLNAASRFLSQSTFGGSYEEIEWVARSGMENWIDNQFAYQKPFDLVDKVIEYNDRKDAHYNITDGIAYEYYWTSAWWHYTMTSQDDLRQRIAFALSEFFVISKFSELGDNAYALSSFYDVLLDNCFGNYREMLEDVTYHPAMGVYLTYMNNPKSDTLYTFDWSVWPPDTTSVQYIFPDENYAREVMQLFSIGLFELNPDGSCKTDVSGNRIITYDNETIAEFSKIFTGLGWSDAGYFKGYPEDFEETYMQRMQMFDEYHEPGMKRLLNGFVVPDRQPVDGHADIQMALDNIFNHPNVGPFLGKFLIQRLVTSNPSPEYIRRVTEAFNGDSQYGSSRGDMKAVIKAILLDEEARNCRMRDDHTYGALIEPFVRYIQLGKAFDLYTKSGNHRNAMNSQYTFIEQAPLHSPSVFNFFQSDYQPIGHIENEDLVAPEFQITNTQTISGFLNGLNAWLFDDSYVDVWGYFDGDETRLEDFPMFDFEDEVALINDEHVSQLIKRLNMIIAHGKLNSDIESRIVAAVQQFEIEDTDCIRDCTPYCNENDPNCDDTPNQECLENCENSILQSKLNRIKLALYLIMSSPEYLINR